MSDILLEATNLSRTYRLPRSASGRAAGERRALIDINAVIRQGDRLGIVGESGCGKSTLVRLLLGLDLPSAGGVKFRGRQVHQGSIPWFRKEVQVVFQDPRSSLDPRMSIYEIIQEPLDCLSVTEDHHQRINEVLKYVDLDLTILSRYPHELSGGERQRVAIARALAPRPSVLIADEPVSALDVLVRDQILDLLGTLTRTLNLTLVLVSHDLSVISRLCESVMVMKDGVVVESGNTLEVFQNPANEFTRELVGAIPRLPRNQ